MSLNHYVETSPALKIKKKKSEDYNLGYKEQEF